MRAKDLTIKQRYHYIKKQERDVLDFSGKKQQYPRGIFKSEEKRTPHSIIKYALKSESSARALECDSTITLMVDVKATKPEIREAAAKLLNCKVRKVNTLICFKKYAKKAFVRLNVPEDTTAAEIAADAGLI